MDEIPTLTAFSYLGFGTLFAAMVLAWRYLPGTGDRDAIRMYLVSAALLFAGAVADVLRYVATPAWAVAVSFVLTLLSQWTALVAARRLLHKGTTPRVFAVITVTGCILALWFAVVAPNFVLRGAVVLTVGAILTGAIAWVFLSSREPGVTVLFRIIGSIYGAYAVLSVARVLMLPRMTPDSDLDQAPASVLANQLSALPLLVLIAVMLITVTARRAHVSVADDRDVAVETSEELLADTWADPLTGLASRARIRSVLRSRLRWAPSEDYVPVILAVLDGSLAQRMGHAAADDAMVTLANAVQDVVAVPAQDWDSAGRWDEESVIVLPPEAGAPAEGLATRLHSRLLEMITDGGHPVSASIALVSLPPGSSLDTAEAALRRASAQARDAGPGGLAMMPGG